MTTIFKNVYVADITNKWFQDIDYPENLKFILFDGINLKINDGLISLAYSNQVIEHIHPDDLPIQLNNIYNSLIDGGYYILTTPHRFRGPADISIHFDKVATCFHLKEYTNIELYRILRKVGFKRVYSQFWLRGLIINIPFPIIQFTELLLKLFPYRLRKYFSGLPIIRSILGICIVAKK